ncbi:MAG: hypothetical protein ACEPOW_06620 [Bacteroidales bacterium]
MDYKTIDWGKYSSEDVLSTLFRLSTDEKNNLLDIMSYVFTTYPNLEFDYVEGFKTVIPMNIELYSTEELLEFGKKIGVNHDSFENNSYLYWYFVLRRLYAEDNKDEYYKYVKRFFLSTDDSMAFVVYEEMVMHAIINKELDLLNFYNIKWSEKKLGNIEGSFIKECIEIYRQGYILDLLYKEDSEFGNADKLLNSPQYQEKIKTWSDDEISELTNLIQSYKEFGNKEVKYKNHQDFYENYWMLSIFFMKYMKEELDMPFYQSYLFAMLNRINWNKKQFKNPWMKGVVDIMEGSGFGEPGDKVSFITYRNFISFHGICYFYEFLYAGGFLKEHEYDQIIENLQLSRQKIFSDFIPNLWVFKSINSLIEPECFSVDYIEKERNLFTDTESKGMESQITEIENFLGKSITTKGIEAFQYA